MPNDQRREDGQTRPDVSTSIQNSQGHNLKDRGNLKKDSHSLNNNDARDLGANECLINDMVAFLVNPREMRRSRILLYSFVLMHM